MEFVCKGVSPEVNNQQKGGNDVPVDVWISNDAADWTVEYQQHQYGLQSLPKDDARLDEVPGRTGQEKSRREEAGRQEGTEVQEDVEFLRLLHRAVSLRLDHRSNRIDCTDFTCTAHNVIPPTGI